ncbi:hypothetical protein [Deinococcus kurensis]|uniref:hypothetical protein n=1 Tax=Deinococcus kurensis TaxID=2662757 RepID=UPI0012D2EF54|nr:hypothetical protein [Deinococcus kurensis]
MEATPKDTAKDTRKSVQLAQTDKDNLSRCQSLLGQSTNGEFDDTSESEVIRLALAVLRNQLEREDQRPAGQPRPVTDFAALNLREQRNNTSRLISLLKHEQGQLKHRNRTQRRYTTRALPH